jgi:hypothetical protein
MWTQVSKSVCQTRTIVILSLDDWIRTRYSSHIIDVIFVHTLYLNLRVDLLGPKFHSQPRGLLDFVVSLVLDPKASGS